MTSSTSEKLVSFCTNLYSLYLQSIQSLESKSSRSQIAHVTSSMYLRNTGKHPQTGPQTLPVQSTVSVTCLKDLSWF